MPDKLTVRERLEQVHRVVEDLRREGMCVIHWEEVAARLLLSGSYVRQLLRIYAALHNYVYHSGRLRVCTAPVTIEDLEEV